MSDTTANYGLYITDDSSERFLEWRTKMNGTESSNMVKIDTALGEKANSSVLVSATLLASAWTGVDSPFTQDITVTGLTATQNGTILLPITQRLSNVKWRGRQCFLWSDRKTAS